MVLLADLEVLERGITGWSDTLRVYLAVVVGLAHSRSGGGVGRLDAFEFMFRVRN